jgi:hypothetical protein
MAWLRFLKKHGSLVKGDILWTDDDKTVDKLTKSNNHKDPIAVQCLGPDGVAFGEASPEDVIKEKDKEKKAKSK